MTALAVLVRGVAWGAAGALFVAFALRVMGAPWAIDPVSVWMLGAAYYVLGAVDAGVGS